MRAAFHYLLIAALLNCPYGCAVATGCETCSRAELPPCCEHCEGTPPAEAIRCEMAGDGEADIIQPQAPLSPAPQPLEHVCRRGVCGGAVLEKAAVDRYSSAVADAAVLTGFVGAGAEARVALIANLPPPSRLSGRALRVVEQSFRC